MAKYIVNVGNIGNIECTNKKQANETFAEYVKQSVSNYGRAAGESVYLMDKTGEAIRIYTGTVENCED